MRSCEPLSKGTSHAEPFGNRQFQCHKMWSQYQPVVMRVSRLFYFTNFTSISSVYRFLVCSFAISFLILLFWCKHQHASEIQPALDSRSRLVSQVHTGSPTPLQSSSRIDLSPSAYGVTLLGSSLLTPESWKDLKYFEVSRCVKMCLSVPMHDRSNWVHKCEELVFGTILHFKMVENDGLRM